MVMSIRNMSDRSPRNLVAGMITDTEFLAEIVPHWADGLFPNDHQNIIGGWCVDYYNEHHEAPGTDVQALYDAWADEASKDDDTTVKAVSRVLSFASDTYKPINTDLLIRQAHDYFNKTMLEGQVSDLMELIETGQTAAAWSRVTDLQQIDLGGTSWAPMSQWEAFDAAFDYGQTPNIIRWPTGSEDVPHPLNTLNNFFAGQFLPESFISILAGEKVGKSWWLSELALQAARSGCRTVHISVGDMTDMQWRKRFIPRIAKRPLKGGAVRIPTNLEPGGVLNDPDAIDFREKVFDPLTKAEFRGAWEAWSAKPEATNLRVINRPMATVSAEMIRTMLMTMGNEGWLPEVLVIDYADILVPMNSRDESRHQIDRTWRELRRISTELGTCVITATQADAASYTQALLTKSHFSEAKQKLAHVTNMFGVNQTIEERDAGVVRLNHIVARDSDVDDVLHVAGCLKLGAPAIYTTF